MRYFHLGPLKMYSGNGSNERLTDAPSYRRAIPKSLPRFEGSGTGARRPSLAWFDPVPDFFLVLMLRDVDALGRIFRDLVPQGPN
jgi:hypothetical protein